MPYVHLSVNKPLAPEAKHELCEEIGKLMPLIPGKTRENTMFHIEDGCFIELADAEPALFMEVRMFRSAPYINKKNYVAKVSDYMEKRLGVDKGRMYINLIEFEDWGVGGEYLD